MLEFFRSREQPALNSSLGCPTAPARRAPCLSRRHRLVGQAHDDEVHLTIENAGQHILRSQPYTYGASGGAQAFAIKFNLLSGYRRSASDSGAAATSGHQLWHRRVA